MRIDSRPARGTPRVGRARAAGARRSNTGRDQGFTLPELLATIVITGLIVTSIAQGIVLVLRQHTNDSGRLDNAITDQSLALWLTPDLVSAEASDTSPDALPCTQPCPAGAETGGSNALALKWQTLTNTNGIVIEVVRQVSYRYLQRDGTYQIVRVECTTSGGNPATCSSQTVVRDAPPPPTGTVFTPGVTVPTWVVELSDPPDVADGTSDNTKGSRRVVISVDGGGEADAVGASADRLAYTAGGFEKRIVVANDTFTSSPLFGQAKSRCGGTFGVVVDTSSSIGAAAMGQVRDGLNAMVDALTGTPIKMQIIQFNTTSGAVGTGNWSQYFDLSDPGQAAALKTGIGALTPGGGTNWEDGLYRMFHTSSGTLQAQQPGTVLFFTDGVPTWSRFEASSTPTTAAPPRWTPDTYPTRDWSAVNNPSKYYQVGYLRARQLVSSFSAGTRFLGVGVGPAIVSDMVEWVDVNGSTITQTPTPAKTVLSRIIEADAPVVVAEVDPATGAYRNADQANLYLLPTFEQFVTALRAVALAACGGTVTVQTTYQGAPLSTAVSYQNTAMATPQGASLPPTGRILTTDQVNTRVTFDFPVTSGAAVIVDIAPIVSSVLDGLRPSGWSCRAGPSARSVATFPVDGGWTGARVQVAANEAVSCTLTVVPA